MKYAAIKKTFICVQNLLVQRYVCLGSRIEETLPDGDRCQPQRRERNLAVEADVVDLISDDDNAGLASIPSTSHNQSFQDQESHINLMPSDS